MWVARWRFSWDSPKKKLLRKLNGKRVFLCFLSNKSLQVSVYIVSSSSDNNDKDREIIFKQIIRWCYYCWLVFVLCNDIYPRHIRSIYINNNKITEKKTLSLSPSTLISSSSNQKRKENQIDALKKTVFDLFRRRLRLAFCSIWPSKMKTRLCIECSNRNRFEHPNEFSGLKTRISFVGWWKKRIQLIWQLEDINIVVKSI